MDEGRESWINQAEAQSLGPSIQMLGKTDPSPLHEGPTQLCTVLGFLLSPWHVSLLFGFSACFGGDCESH